MVETVPAVVWCKDREYWCERGTCRSCGCQSPFTQMEAVANAVAMVLTKPDTTRREIREALLAFADEIMSSMIETDDG